MNVTHLTQELPKLDQNSSRRSYLIDQASVNRMNNCTFLNFGWYTQRLAFGLWLWFTYMFRLVTVNFPQMIIRSIVSTNSIL